MSTPSLLSMQRLPTGTNKSQADLFDKIINLDFLTWLNGFPDISK